MQSHERIAGRAGFLAFGGFGTDLVVVSLGASRFEGHLGREKSGVW